MQQARSAALVPVDADADGAGRHLIVQAVIAALDEAALEIDGDPSRLDLPDTACRNAREYHAVFSLGSDAHATGELQQMELATATARRAMFPPGRAMLKAAMRS